MAYTKTNWVNNGTPPLSAANLNNIENGIYNCDSRLTTVENVVGPLSSYSTTETAIGTWIDGSVIYRKVIDVGALPNATTKLVQTDITNLSLITKIYGVAHSSSGDQITIPIPDTFPATNNNTYAIRLCYDPGTTSIKLITVADRSMFSGYVILEYTKTS